MKIPLALLSLIATICFADARTWTSREGIKVDAEMVKTEGETVTIRLTEDGTEISFKLEELSLPDQEFVVKVRAEKQAAEILARLKRQEEIKRGNYEKPWPEKVEFEDEVEIVLVEEDKEKKRFVYQSQHYEFICDVRLNTSVVRNFSKMFEATFKVMEELPMNFTKAIHFEEGKRLKILLFETRDEYIKAGGPPSSGGVYMGSRNIVMVPLKSLGVKPLGSGYSLDRKVANQTLSHELVHQLTDWVYFPRGARGWFTEGIAEYVSSSPYSNGRFFFKSNIRTIADSVTEYDRKSRTGSALGDEIVFKNLKQYMLQSYAEFTANSRFNYAMGMVLTTYFIHLDEEGSRKRLTAFLKAMRAGKKGEDLLKVLLDGRSWRELEGDIATAWRSRGIKLKFE